MAIANKIAGHLSRSSWIRKMFEEGERLRHEHGADKVFDFTLGNPDLEPPETFKKRCGNWRTTRCRVCTVI